MKHSSKAIVGILVVGGAVAIGMFSNRKQLSPTPPSSQPVVTTDTVAKVSETPVQTNPTSTPGLPKSAMKLTPKDQRKMVVLQEILKSKNDNDPRMDKDLTDLSPEAKRAMEGYYKEIESEKRNDLGTIVFLIGRKISAKEDVDFLKSVLMEKPCQSLADCSKSDTPSSSEAAHLEGINETTANYPQLMALRQMTEQYRMLQGDPNSDPALPAQILSSLKDATRSPNPKVQSDAELAIQYLTGKNK